MFLLSKTSLGNAQGLELTTLRSHERFCRYSVQKYN